MRHKQLKHFGVTLLISFAIHLFILTVLFTVPTDEKDDGLKKVRIKLGTTGKSSSGSIASVERYTSFTPASPPDNQQVNGNSTRDVAASGQRNAGADTAVSSDKSPAVAKFAGGNIDKSSGELGEPQEFERVLEQVSKNINLPTPPQAFEPSAGKASEDSEEEGVVIGNSSTKDAGRLASYEQLLPLWLHKFKKYPEEARAQNITGTGEIFIKIDRKGKILLSKVIKSTGSQVLDEALMKMISAADPVIPVPDNYYSSKKTFSYKIAFTFDHNE